jgi:hypothetical protein
MNTQAVSRGDINCSGYMDGVLLLLLLLLLLASAL